MVTSNKTNGATVFYSFPHDTEIASIKGMNVIHVLAEIGQRSMNSLCNNNYTTLNATANEHSPKQCDKSGENAEVKSKINEEWRKPTKFVPITYFCKQQNKKGKNNNDNNINNNACNISSINAEIELNNEEDAAQMMIKEKINPMKKECIQEQEKSKILEVENEIFENIMRDCTIEANARQKDVKRG